MNLIPFFEDSPEQKLNLAIYLIIFILIIILMVRFRLIKNNFNFFYLYIKKVSDFYLKMNYNNFYVS